MDRRWRVTDFQRILIFFAGVVALFVAAMALGSRNAWWLLGSAAVLGGTVVSVIMLQVRRGGAGAHVLATARVISASSPPVNAGIAARCDMRLLVYLPGRGKVETRLRDRAVPLTRWPQPGQTFPVDVYGGNPHRRLHIRWDLVDQGVMRAPEPGSSASTAMESVIWEEEERPLIVSPTPPRPRRAAARTSAPPPPTAVGTPAVHLFEEFTDLDGNPLRTTHDPNGHDPDGYDPADFEEPRLESVILPDFDPADVDRRDFDGEPAAGPADQRPAPAGEQPARPIPAPRPAEPPPRVLPDSPIRGGTGLDTALPVADLARSLRFYQDQLGLTVAYTASDSAVVESEGTRILLEHVGRPPGLQPQSGEIHLQVTDIEATCAALRERGVTFLDPPAPVSSSEATQLWRARLRDPDGHEIVIIERRDRPS